MLRPSSLLGSAVAAALLAPLAAGAAAPVYFVPPKLVKQGKAQSAIGGAGTVVVQVLVQANGSFHVQRILRSTNHDDDAAALEIAQTSKYKPARKGSKAQMAFYDYTLRFTGAGVASSGGGTAATGLPSYEMMLRAGNYAGAAAGLKEYLAAHPGDERANLDLGLTDAFQRDYVAAAEQFDAAGTIPETDKAVVSTAYNEAALAAIKAKDAAKGVALAKKAVATKATFATYNTLGYAEYGQGDFTAATADLEKARALGAGENAPGQQRALVDVNLVSAYLGAGNEAMAKTVAAEVTQLAPQETGAQNALVAYSSKKAADLAKSGKYDDAAGLLEQVAPSAPSQAAALYGRAGSFYLNAQPKPENDKAKADADKALAIDPDNAFANFVAGVALANLSKTKDALVYLNKADASAKKAGDSTLAAEVEKSINQLNGK
jgi:TonB family protein